MAQLQCAAAKAMFLGGGRKRTRTADLLRVKQSDNPATRLYYTVLAILNQRKTLIQICQKPEVTSGFYIIRNE